MKLMVTKLFFVAFCFLLVFFSVWPAAATDYSSSSFKVKDPVISAGSATSTSSNFGLGQSLAQTAAGKSTSTSFQLWSGFQYYFFARVLYLEGALEDGRARLFWRVPLSGPGSSIASYEVGTGTVSGSYTFQNVGNVNTFTKTGLTNGTRYYFRVKAKDGSGAQLALSNEFSTVPRAVYTAESFDALPPGQTLTPSFSSSNGTNVNFTIPPGALPTGDTYRMEVNALPKTELISSMPPPSGKTAAATMFEFTMFKESDLSSFSSFSEPLTVQVAYTDADVSGLDTSTLSLSRWNGSEWSALSSQTLNTSAKTISGTTSSFSNFAILGTAASPSPSPSPSPSSGGGGGGGGGGGSKTTTSGATIVLKGLAMPGATVFVLKDGAVAASTTADPAAGFNISLTGLSSGIYSFTLYAEDGSGARSASTSFIQSLTSGVTNTVDNIFLGPTIGVSHSIIKQGDTLNIFGFTAPASDVSVFINSPQQFIEKTKAGETGAWAKAFNTVVLDRGAHNSKSQSAKGDLLSPYSSTVEFQVGETSVAAPAPGTDRIGDFNDDGRVNLVDFSILLFYWNQGNPQTDINRDGIVNLTDFSILLFNWTG